MSPNKDYLGDSVYAEMDQYGGLVLTTENGYGPSNTIILKPQVQQALVYYTRRVLDNPNWPDKKGIEP